MAAHPRQARLGLLPLSAHVNPRLAWRGLRLIGDPSTSPWISLGRSLLARLRSKILSHPPLDPRSPSYGVLVPFPYPQLTLLTRPARGLASHLGIAATEVPAVLNRICAALKALPPPAIVAPVPVGPWCAYLPLWSNPLLLNVACACCSLRIRC